MHAIHKLLAANAGKETVVPGELVHARVDLAGINDIYRIVIESFKQMGGKKVADPKRIAVFQDHLAPSMDVVGAESQKVWREFAKEQGIDNLFENERGVCHEVAMQAGLIRPGMIVVMTDSHSTTHGALGAMGCGLGATDMAVTILEGSLWFKVPEIIKVRLEGTLKECVAAKDIALFILGQLGADFANYKVVEYCGPVVDAMSIEERMVLCNMAVEMGAKSGYIQPDAKTEAYVKSKSAAPYTVYETDADFKYYQEHVYNVDNLAPQVAASGRVDDAHVITELAGTPIDQVFIGSCTGGRITDMAVAAKILEGKKIAPGTRLIITPASKEVLEEALERGYLKTFYAAGAVVTSPTCGPCFGAHAGVLAPGERGATTSSRNYPGRMGSTEAEIYLVSVATAAMTAITGKLTDCRTAV